MNNHNLTYSGDGTHNQWHIKKGAGISVKRPGMGWSHTEWATKDIYFDDFDIEYYDKTNIVFRRKFNGEMWYLKINKVV